MSKIGNYVVDMQETPDYQFGWESAERGEPAPDWTPDTGSAQFRFVCQRKGWADYHHAERAP